VSKLKLIGQNTSSIRNKSISGLIQSAFEL